MTPLAHAAHDPALPTPRIITQGEREDCATAAGANESALDCKINIQAARAAVEKISRRACVRA